MKIILCLLLGYLLGTLNPAALISKIKHTSLRENGTGNLGATNTMLVFGKKLGALVMLFDIFKGYIAVKSVAAILPTVKWLSMAAGALAVVGHCFPFYMSFKGGKGLAAFAGVVLAYNPLLFLFLLITGVILMLIVNYTYILPFYAAVFFSVYVAVKEYSMLMIFFAVSVSAIIVFMHFGNFIKALNGNEKKVREYIKTKLFNKRNTE